MGASATLYGMKQSHAVLAARLMLERSGLEHRVRYLLPGPHPLIVRALGFGGWTVPALRLGPERVVGTLAIARALDAHPGARRLFPEDPARRAAVDAAERWGHDELQEPVRRIFRAASVESNDLRAWLVREVMRLPVPDLQGRLLRPVFRLFADRVSHATPERVRLDLAELPAKLDHADRLVEEGVIGGEEPNAADFQILASLRLLVAFDDLRPLAEPHASVRAALALVPHFPAPPPHELPSIPPALPAEWLAAAAPAA